MTEQIVQPLTQEEQLAALGRYEYGWADSDAAGAAAQRGLNEAVVRDISAKKNEPAVDARPAAEGPAAVRPQADAGLGRRPLRHRLRQHQVLRALHREAGHQLGGPARRTSRTPTTGWASPRRRSSGWSPGSRRSTSPRWSTTRSVRTSRSRVSSSWTPTPRSSEHEDVFKEYFGTVIPVGDNKFAALNTSVWSGGSFIYVPKGVQRGDPAAGVLPDQHREHGPVRADADHRRRGRVRALRRGLHRADLLVRLAAQRGRRDHRARRTPAAATRPSRTGRTTSTTWSPSAPCATRARPWSGSTATSAPRSP